MSAAKHTPTHLPWKVRGTSIYFANVAGGFDVRNCPDPEALAAFIVRACNSHDALVAALECTDVITRNCAQWRDILRKHGWDGKRSATEFVREMQVAALKAAKGEA